MFRSASCILAFLLFEADFFVDEKDLQTFVGATSQSRFFFAYVFREPVLADIGSEDARQRFEISNHAPVFHYVMAGIHWGRQQVLPVIAMPHGIKVEGRLCRLSGPVRGRLVERAAHPGGKAMEFVQQHDYLLYILPGPS